MTWIERTAIPHSHAMMCPHTKVHECCVQLPNSSLCVATAGNEQTNPCTTRPGAPAQAASCSPVLSPVGLQVVDALERCSLCLPPPLSRGSAALQPPWPGCTCGWSHGPGRSPGHALLQVSRHSSTIRSAEQCRAHTLDDTSPSNQQSKC